MTRYWNRRSATTTRRQRRHRLMWSLGAPRDGLCGFNASEHRFRVCSLRTSRRADVALLITRRSWVMQLSDEVAIKNQKLIVPTIEMYAVFKKKMVSAWTLSFLYFNSAHLQVLLGCNALYDCKGGIIRGRIEQQRTTANTSSWFLLDNNGFRQSWGCPDQLDRGGGLHDPGSQQADSPAHPTLRS